MTRRRDHLAAIDVGTNAARLKVARHAGGRLDEVTSERAPIEPGQGVFERGVMAPPVVDRLCETLAGFDAVCRFHRAEVRAVATSALRSAKNRAEVVARVQRETGVRLEVIDGLEEARLTALGVVAGSDSDVRSLCIDIGGGSTEIMLSEGETLAAAHSVEVGGARLVQLVGDDVDELRQAARGELRALEPKLGRRFVGDDATAIGCSGSVRSLVAFATEEARRYVTRHELTSTVDELARMKPSVRARFFGRRAHTALAAAVILEQAMARLGLWAVRATRRGLRDGVLVEMARSSRRISAAATAVKHDRRARPLAS